MREANFTRNSHSRAAIRRGSTCLASLFASLCLCGALVAAEPQVLFEDHFDGKLGDGWTWLREDPAARRFGDKALEIRVEPGLAPTVKNALLRKAPDRAAGPFAVEATITFIAPPTHQYEQAGITLYRKGNPAFKLVHEHIDGSEWIIPGKVAAPAAKVQLRLVIDGDKFRTQFRPDAKGEYHETQSGKLPPADDDQISIQCYNGPADAAHWIRFEDFRIVRLPTAEAGKLCFDTYSGYFVSNKFEPDAARSFAVVQSQQEFDKIFGAGFVMHDKSHRLPKDAFKTLTVIAAIKRGNALTEYKVDSVTATDGTLKLAYSTTEKKSDTATFACPLIVSLPKGQYKTVEFIENGKTAKKLDTP